MYNKALDTFMAVADNRSFTKASEQLFISHTAVMKQINGLESDLGVQLFKRSNHGVTLTLAGHTLYQKAQEIINFSEKAIQEIQKAHFGAPQTIRVGTSLFYPAHIFMNLWDSFSEHCPQFHLKIVSIPDDSQYLAGLNKLYDFLVGAYNAELGGAMYTFIPVGKYHFTLSLPRKHPLSRRSSLSFEDLAGETLMIMKRGYSTINDQIRSDIEISYPEIIIEDISPHYSLQTFNHCVDRNAILLSLECWNHVHPGLTTVPLNGCYSLPYGIVTAADIPTELEEFLCTIKSCLVPTS